MLKYKDMNVYLQSLISNMNSLTHTHFTPTSRRVPGSKDSGSLCNSEQRNRVRAVLHTNTVLTCPQCGCPQIWSTTQGSADPPQHRTARTPKYTRGYWARARSFVKGQAQRMSLGKTLSCHANEAVWIWIWIWGWHWGWERESEREGRKDRPKPNWEREG